MGFFDSLDEEANEAFLNRVNSTQKELKNVQVGEAVVPITTPQNDTELQAFGKSTLDDDEVDFFKEFALEEIEDNSQIPFSKDGTHSSAKNSDPLLSYDVEFETSEITEINSKDQKDILQQEEIGSKEKQDEETTREDSNVALPELATACAIQQDRILETIEEEPQKCEEHKAAEQNTPEKAESTEKIDSPNIETGAHPIQQQISRVEIECPKTIEPPSNVQTMLDIEHNPVPIKECKSKKDCRQEKREGLAEKITVLKKPLLLLNPRTSQEKLSQKRKHSRSRSPALFFTKILQPVLNSDTQCQSKHRDLSLTPRKKQKKTKNTSEGLSSGPSPKETNSSLSHRVSNEIAEIKEKEVNPLPRAREIEKKEKKEKSSRKETNLILNHHTEEYQKETMEELDLDSPDFNELTKELEFMMLDAKAIEDQLLDMKLSLAIQSNKLVRLDSPIIHQKLDDLKQKAQDLLEIL